MTEDSKQLSYAIIGVGGVGGYLGGLLARAGFNVTFFARQPTVEVLRAQGLILRTVDEEIVLPHVTATSSFAELASADVILVTTKSYDLETVARGVSPIAAGRIFITFQNGIDSDLVFRRHAPGAEVFPGVAYIVSARKSPGVIEQSAGPRKFLIGDRERQMTRRFERIAGEMRSAGIDCDVADDVERALWTKFVWILAFAGVTGACRSSIGPIVNDPGGFLMFERIVDETISVAQALGIALGDSERDEVLAKAAGYRTKATGAKSSLALDIENGRSTEIEALHGRLVTLARELNIPVPTSEAIYNSIRFAEKSIL